MFDLLKKVAYDGEAEGDPRNFIDESVGTGTNGPVCNTNMQAWKKLHEKVALGDIIDQARGLATQYSEGYPDMQEWARLNTIPTPKQYLKKTARAIIPPFNPKLLKKLRIEKHNGSDRAGEILSAWGSRGGRPRLMKKIVEQKKNSEPKQLDLPLLFKHINRPN